VLTGPKDPFLNRISFAFRSFFSLLFSGTLPADIANASGYFKPVPVRMPTVAQETPAAQKEKAPAAKTQDGAVQILALLQRDARLIDFLMEDLTSFSDEQVGAAVRDVQVQSRQILDRCFQPVAVIDAIEGDDVKTGKLSAHEVRFTGNVPAKGTAPGGVLRHKGWKASKIELPAASASAILAPAEIEVE
jgi:Domain of unknown function (DUF2760)